jgi:hypothetical protein
MPNSEQATKPPRTIEDVYREVEQRVENNRKTEALHPDLGVRLQAQARAEAYSLVLGLLAQPLATFLSEKERPRQCQVMTRYGQCAGPYGHNPELGHSTDTWTQDQ